MNLLRVENLSFYYEDLKVLNKVSFSLEAGKFTALIGVNGAGKSTLLKLLLNELKPSAGSIHWSKPFTSFSYVSQDVRGTGFPANVMEVVQSNLYISKPLFSFYNKKDKDRVREALALVSMQEYEKSLFSELSGGQRQRVMLARALVSSPEVMILDEPTSGVDKESTLSMYRLVSDLCHKGMSVLLVSHDVDVIRDYADVILKMENGNVGYEHATV